MEVLRAHFDGEGTTAERLRETLHYKGECSLAFAVFLNHLQWMHNIFDKEGEAMAEDTKLQDLFKHVQHPELKEVVKALEVEYDLRGMIFTQAANHITAAVSKLPEYTQIQKISAANMGKQTPGKRNGIYNSNALFTRATTRTGKSC